jgi:hypothetical protein
MPLIDITPASGNAEDLLKPPEYPVLPGGKHLFVIAEPFVLEPSNSNPENNIIKAVYRCQDEDENKGMAVFENFVFIGNPQKEGQFKSIEINKARLAQLAIAAGVSTEADIRAGKQFDLDDFHEKVFSAISTVKNEDTQEINTETGKPIKAPKASIKKYLYEPVSA